MSDVLNRDKLLDELGYGHEAAHERAVEILVAAKLTVRVKTNIAADKRAKLVEVLTGTLVVLCRVCRESWTSDGREVVPSADPHGCTNCRGSSARRALDHLAIALRSRSVRRVVVVGGSPGTREELEKAWPAGAELRLVVGNRRHTEKDARANLEWADVVVIWGATELDHKVSQLYTRSPLAAGKLVAINKRGIEALADAIATHIRIVIS